jgi:hypothetical protein
LPMGVVLLDDVGLLSLSHRFPQFVGPGPVPGATGKSARPRLLASAPIRSSRGAAQPSPRTVLPIQPTSPVNWLVPEHVVAMRHSDAGRMAPKYRNAPNTEMSRAWAWQRYHCSAFAMVMRRPPARSAAPATK